MLCIFSVYFFLTGIFLPKSLTFIYNPWMIFASYLAWINTHIILFILYSILFIPIGIIIKIFKIDLLGKNRKEKSYWTDPVIDSRKNVHYTKQY